MSDVITIGETMAALVPETKGALRYVSAYGIRPAGAESNVAVGLAKLGFDAMWFSRVGEDEFGHYLCNQTRAEGVDCTHLYFDSDHHTGVMFKQTGVGETRVYYYRENSAASHMQPDDLQMEWFRDTKIIHISGITPVLSESCRETTLHAFDLARQNNALISFDPNIRRKLWNGRNYVPMIRKLTLDSDIVLIGLDEAEILFEKKDPDNICDILLNRGNAKYIAIKDGKNGAFVANNKARMHIPPFPCRPVDPIGAGDGFNAGFLAGILKNCDISRAGQMGAICGALATQVSGDVEGYPDIHQMKEALENTQVIFR
jgi:2-dehydro-3-deoxygluconokinase